MQREMQHAAAGVRSGLAALRHHVLVPTGQFFGGDSTAFFRRAVCAVERGMIAHRHIGAACWLVTARLYNLKRPKSQFCSTMRAFCMIGISAICNCALLLCFCLRPKWPLRGADYARRLHGAALPIQWRDARATRVAAEVACLQQAAGGSRPKSRSCDWRRRQRGARRADKKQKELMSLFLMCALRRGITCSRSIATDPINCNRSDVKQISQKPVEPIGTAVEQLRRCLRT
jgi:hypothetical protein